MPAKQEQISLDELIDRCERTARKMSAKNPGRLVLLNAAAVLGSLGRELEKAWKEVADLKAQQHATQHPKAPLLILSEREWRNVH